MARILIVEDYEVISQLLTRSMKMWGHEVVGVAANLSSALEEARLAKEKGVQVAIVDGDLKSGAPWTSDGETVAAALREYAPDVRIIAHTAHAKGEYGHFFVPKPCLAEVMKGTIETALKLSQQV